MVSVNCTAHHSEVFDADYALWLENDSDDGKHAYSIKIYIIIVIIMAVYLLRKKIIILDCPTIIN